MIPPSASVQEYNAAPRSYILHSRWSCSIPTTDLCSWLFTSATFPLPHSPAIYISADNPSRQSISLHGFRSLVLRIARGLREVGLGPGQRVLTISSNNVFYPALFLGIIAAGGVFTGANPSHTPRELAVQLRDSGATFCVVGDAVVETAVRVAGMVVGLDKRNIFIFDESLVENERCWETDGINLAKQHSVRHWSEFVSPTDDFIWTVFTTAKQADTIAAINYSSGTTGVPKGVGISHWNFIANLIQLLEATNLSPSPQPAPARQIGVLPMYHAYGQMLYVMLCPSRGTPVYMVGTSGKNKNFDFLGYLRQISKYRITSITAVPSILVALAKLPPAVLSQIDLSCVKYVTCGSAPLSADIRKSVESLLTKQQPPGQSVCVRQAWGMTETTCAVLCHHPDDTGEDNSVGELMPNCEAKVVDPSTGDDLPANVPGELYVRGPNVSKGYHNNPAATAAAFVDGWLRTGDAGYYNSMGRFFIVDRIKELIKVKGHQVAPAELESVLLEHPEISDVAVIGIPHAHDEQPRAYVVANKNPVSGVEVSAEDATAWVKERCAPYKWITGGVVFVDEIPRNLSGKILRKVLKERASLEVDVKAKL